MTIAIRAEMLTAAELNQLKVEAPIGMKFTDGAIEFAELPDEVAIERLAQFAHWQLHKALSRPVKWDALPLNEQRAWKRNVEQLLHAIGRQAGF